jgi:GABA permease
MSTKARVLVVANRTVDSSELVAALRQRATRSPASFTLLVPAVPRGLSWAGDMKAGGPEAELRAEKGAHHMRSCGLEIEAATVGDPDPLAAVGDALLTDRFDEVVVATLPHGVSHWLRLSLPQRLRRLTDLPVLHVTAHPRHVRRGSRPRELAGVSS